MKKTVFTLLAVLVLAALGAGIWYFFLRPTPVYHAEEILPATTIALLQIPNVDQARQRWDQTPLARIFREPEVLGFWEQPARVLREKMDTAPGTRDAESFLAPLKKVFAHIHGEAFIGFLGYDLTPRFSAQLVAGFDAGNESKGARKSIEELAAEFRTRFPKGVREEKKHLGVAYETWSPEKNLVVCHARLGNLFLFATDETALQTCIELAKGNRDHPLKNDETFQKTVAKVDDQRDALVYVNPGQVFGKLLPLLATVSQAGSGLKDLTALKAVAASSRFEPSGPVDQVFFLMPEASRPASFKIAAPWERKSLPLVSSKALFYGITCLDFGRYWDDTAAVFMESASAPPFGKAVEEFTKLLETQNIHLRPDLIGKLGREFAVQVNWGEQDQLPNLFLMMETSDGAGFVASLDRFLTLMSAAMPPGVGPKPAAGLPPGPNTLEVGGKMIHWITLAAEQGIGIYYVHLEPFVVFGFQGDAMTSYVNAVAKKQFEDFSANPVFKSASASMPKSVNTFLYLDNKPFFEKVYNLAAPLAMLGASFLPNQKAVDFTKLPKTSAISGHLSPSICYQYFDSDGLYRYSSGPIPPEAPFLVAGVTAGFVLPAYLQAQQQAAAHPSPAPRPPGAAPRPGVTDTSKPAPGTPAAAPTKKSEPAAPSVEEAACRELLKAVDDAKAKWAAENHAPSGSTVFESQIKPYLDPKFLANGKLACPLSGQILIGDVGQSATSTALMPLAEPEAPAPTAPSAP